MTSVRKLELEHPIRLDDGTFIRAVIVRAPTHEDLQWVRFELYGRFTGLDRALIDEMDAADLRAIDEILDEFSKR